MGRETMSKWRIGLMVGLPVAFLLSACSGGASTEISADMTDFQFSPTEWTVPAGEEITIELTNDGSVEHEFVILQSGVTISDETALPETEEELLADFVYWEDEVEPGETKTATFTAPPAGEYQVICAIEGHFDAGMEGTLTSE
jgi:uncharacterized cupredoxin-like copper-binding protein